MNQLRLRLRKVKVLKKTITYKNLFTDEEITEDFFFHISKAELVELELSHPGGLSESLQNIIAAEDGKGIVDEFKNIILMAYGKRSEDGKRFVKNANVREEFESSEAYSALFMELVTNTESAIEFINGIIPQGMADEAAKITGADLEVVKPPRPIVVSQEEIQKMKPDDLTKLGARVAAGEIVIAGPED
jgi:hypothetical protein